MQSAKERLQRLIVQFNFLPSMELHPERRDQIASVAVWRALAASPAGHRQLSASLLARERLLDDLVTAFETRERRIALLGWKLLDRLVVLAGTALNAEWIATRIGRSEVATLKSGLGADLYAFALGRARFLGDIAGWPAPPNSTDCLQWIERAGLRYIEACMQQQPHALRGRLVLRLPLHAEIDAPEGSALPLPEPERAIALFRKLAPEVGEPCTSLLA